MTVCRLNRHEVRELNEYCVQGSVGRNEDFRTSYGALIVSCRIQIWQILDFEILECGLGLVVDEYFFHGKSTPSGDKANDLCLKRTIVF